MTHAAPKAAQQTKKVSVLTDEPECSEILLEDYNKFVLKVHLLNLEALHLSIICCKILMSRFCKPQKWFSETTRVIFYVHFRILWQLLLYTIESMIL